MSAPTRPGGIGPRSSPRGRRVDERGRGSAEPAGPRKGHQMRHLHKISQPVYLAAGLSIVAAQIHAYLLAEHFSMWWGYGAAFLAMVLLQDVFSVLLVTHQ